MGDVSLFLSTGILAVAGFLTILGLILKYRTGTSTEIICLSLFVTSLMIWSVIALVQQLTAGIGISLVYIFFERGLNYGIVSACMSVFGWDLGHGIYKYVRNRKEKKSNAEDNA